jgi:hypothetical protein
MLARAIENVSFHDGEVSKLFAEYLRGGKMDGEFVIRHKDGNPISIRYRAFVFDDGCTVAVWKPIATMLFFSRPRILSEMISQRTQNLNQ